ncbi:unnamed protein product, partial [Porites evermanni]
ILLAPLVRIDLLIEAIKVKHRDLTKNNMVALHSTTVKCSAKIRNLDNVNLQTREQKFLQLKKGSKFGREQRQARIGTEEWQSARDHGKGEEERREAKHLLARFLLPAFLCEQIYIERATSGNEASLQRSAYFFITYEAEFNNCSVILLPARYGASCSVVLSKINVKSVLFFAFGVFAVFLTARFAHAHYKSRMIVRFPSWGDHGKPHVNRSFALALAKSIYLESVKRQVRLQPNCSIFNTKAAWPSGEHIGLPSSLAVLATLECIISAVRETTCHVSDFKD